MGKIKYNEVYNFESMEKRMPDLKFIKFNCPHCTNDNGKFGEIILYVPKDDKYEIATQCNCNGQEDRCSVLLDLMQSYNCEKMLKKLLDQK